LADADLNAIVGAHGGAFGLVLADEAWSHYELGSRYTVVDPSTRAPAKRNPFIAARPEYGWPSDYSVQALQRRGVRFVGCNQSLRNLARDIAKERSEPVETVESFLRANVLSGVVIVPAMIVAVNR